MKQVRNRTISLLTAFAMVITCFCGFGSAGVFAAEENSTAALSVYDGNQLVKEYSLDDLKAIAAKEGNKKYKYSGYNRNPSFYTFGDPDNEKTPSREDVKECIGPTVEGILADAGISYTDKQSVTILGNDGYGQKFIAEDIFGERYYFPNGAGIKNGDGAKAENYEGAQVTPAIIDIYDKSPETAYVDTVLRFGQKVPNERNNTFFAKYVAAGGKIIVGDEVSEQWEAVNTPKYNSGTVLPDTVIEFDTKYVNNKYAAGTVYYTVAYSNGEIAPNGTEPKAGDTIYNYDKYEGINPPTLEEEGIYTIKLKVIGYGLLDSETTTFTYKVKDVDVAKPEGVVAGGATPNSVELTWNKVESANGYEVLRYDEAKGEYGIVASVVDNKYTDSNLVANKKYKYIVRAILKLDSGQVVYGSGQEVSGTAYKAQTVEPPIDDPADENEPPIDNDKPDINESIETPTLKSVTRKSYNSIQITWNKVEGATGYEINRYDAVSKKGICIDIKGGSFTSYTNKNLKTGREYAYKIRAYKTQEDGNRVYSDDYSSIKKAKATLSKPSVSLKAGKKSITVKWKKVSGATGYKIYRSTKKSSGYKVVKTIKKGSTVSWKNTKLKKGKKYYYKVKAYRVVDKKNVYSSYSSLKYAKAK